MSKACRRACDTFRRPYSLARAISTHCSFPRISNRHSDERRAHMLHRSGLLKTRGS
jgi:hypothetical protein